jgi:Ca2+-binding RTX toxin-like protein
LTAPVLRKNQNMKTLKPAVLASDKRRSPNETINRPLLPTITQMKSMFVKFQHIRLAMSLALGMGYGTVAWADTLVQSVEVSPNPLLLGQPFTISVSASSNVTFVAAEVDFQSGPPQKFEIPVTKQGSIWIGSGTVPSDLRLHANVDEVKLKITAQDSAFHRDNEVVRVDVAAPTISAVFTNGVLTVTGDNQDNTLIASRDAAGNILINGGAIPITGGVPTVTNTTLIRMFGFDGNDVLTVDDANGHMPPAQLYGGEGDDILTGSASDDLLDGGPGNDMLFGRGGDDILIGGPGNNILVGGPGADQIFGGDGDDVIVWNPGDGSDVVEGGGGQNTLVFNGSNADEVVDLSTNGQRLRFFRNVANITMDCNGIQTVVFNALGGADTVTINDLTGTDVTNVLVNLAASNGAGDGKADTVIVNGTDGNDHIVLSGSVTNVDVTGLSATVRIVGAEAGLDRLVVNALGGDDIVDASAVLAGAIDLTLNGGDGNDVLIGGDGNDILNGGRGSDIMDGGPGDDIFIWNPGDGSDVIEGGSGQDTMVFNGANVNEVVNISANGPRVRFTRDVGNIVMDCNGIEVIQFAALGGADSITINDLTGTGVTKVALDLASPAGSGMGDNQADSVIINGTAGNDNVSVAGSAAAGITVTGLVPTVTIVGTDPTLDQLFINLLAGDDAFEATGLPAGLIQLIVDGGPGNDIIVGSPGNDILLGGDGDDILIGNGGLDTLDGGPGNNVIIH